MTKFFKTLFFYSIFINSLVLSVVRGQPILNKKVPAYILNEVQEISGKTLLSVGSKQRLIEFFLTQDSLANLALLKGDEEIKLSKFYKIDDKNLKQLLTPKEWTAFAVYKQSSKLSDLITYRKEIGLKNHQVDTILNRIVSLKFLKDDLTRYNVNPLPYVYDFEKKTILQTLDRKQLFKYFEAKNKVAALTNCRRYWDDLYSYSLTGNQDKEKCIQELVVYEEKRLLAIDRAEYEKSFKNDSLKVVEELSKPFILLKRFAFQNKLPQSRLTELISFRKDVKLSESQIDTLIKKIVKLELDKLDFLSKNNSGKFYSQPFEIAVINSLLNKGQLNDYIVLKNKSYAYTVAKKQWENLKKNGLSSELVESSTLKELANYNYQQLIAADHAKFDNSQQNLLLLKSIEGKKPQSLQLLDEFERNKKDAALKKSFAW